MDGHRGYFHGYGLRLPRLSVRILQPRLVQGRLDRLWYLLGFIYIFILTVPKEGAWFGPVVALVVAVIVLARTVLFRRAQTEA